MYFDDASSKEGAGVGVLFVSPTNEQIPLSYKLEFGNRGVTNNVSEYEAIVFGLEVVCRMGITLISIF